MNKIMVDNWLMEDVIADIRDNKSNQSKAYADLLMAMVLWDEVYYPQNDYNWWNSVPSEVQGLLNPISDYDEKSLDAPIMDLLLNADDIESSDLEQLKRKKLLLEHSAVMGKGALRYMALSNDYGCDYLPCHKRRIFLYSYFSNEEIERFLTRLKAKEHLDKIIKEYYVETYKALLDFSAFDFQMPTLVNYIINNAPHEMKPIEYALHLKHEGAVVAYRKYLTQVDEAIEQQNWRELRYLLKCSEDAVSDVISLDRKFISKTNCLGLPNPTVLLDSISVDIGLPPTISINIDLKKFSNMKKVRLTFLKDIVTDGINCKKFW